MSVSGIPPPTPPPPPPPPPPGGGPPVPPSAISNPPVNINYFFPSNETSNENKIDGKELIQVKGPIVSEQILSNAIQALGLYYDTLLNVPFVPDDKVSAKQRRNGCMVQSKNYHDVIHFGYNMTGGSVLNEEITEDESQLDEYMKKLWTTEYSNSSYNMDKIGNKQNRPFEAVLTGVSQKYTTWIKKNQPKNDKKAKEPKATTKDANTRTFTIGRWRNCLNSWNQLQEIDIAREFRQYKDEERNWSTKKKYKIVDDTTVTSLVKLESPKNLKSTLSRIAEGICASTNGQRNISEIANSQTITLQIPQNEEKGANKKTFHACFLDDTDVALSDVSWKDLLSGDRTDSEVDRSLAIAEKHIKAADTVEFFKGLFYLHEPSVVELIQQLQSQFLKIDINQVILDHFKEKYKESEAETEFLLGFEKLRTKYPEVLQFIKKYETLFVKPFDFEDDYSFQQVCHMWPFAKLLFWYFQQKNIIAKDNATDLTKPFDEILHSVNVEKDILFFFCSDEETSRWTLFCEDLKQHVVSTNENEIEQHEVFDIASQCFLGNPFCDGLSSYISKINAKITNSVAKKSLLFEIDENEKRYFTKFSFKWFKGHHFADIKNNFDKLTFAYLIKTPITLVDLLLTISLEAMVLFFQENQLSEYIKHMQHFYIKTGQKISVLQFNFRTILLKNDDFVEPEIAQHDFLSCILGICKFTDQFVRGEMPLKVFTDDFLSTKDPNCSYIKAYTGYVLDILRGTVAGILNTPADESFIDEQASKLQENITDFKKQYLEVVRTKANSSTLKSYNDTLQRILAIPPPQHQQREKEQEEPQKKHQHQQPEEKQEGPQKKHQHQQREEEQEEPQENEELHDVQKKIEENIAQISAALLF